MTYTDEAEMMIDEDITDEGKLALYHELIGKGIDPDEAEMMVWEAYDD